MPLASFRRTCFIHGIQSPSATALPLGVKGWLEAETSHNR